MTYAPRGSVAAAARGALGPLGLLGPREVRVACEPSAAAGRLAPGRRRASGVARERRAARAVRRGFVPACGARRD
ncbi:hypothetical protein AQ932_16360 [Burkholderia pseudomallei]|nr:hypothetical protein AQ855_16085 [Burkholderia pseudomallei]OMZ02726.1 hypothetical protein AQ854_24545 [Burkholderia pseudomallei]OMZ03339.1 hypothetical protein AQ856_30270 [Burkholderia pseudomallei]OMZ91195.1 hypothetical protein AQ870_28255 [Burkholderia pseudomallei]ONC36073.1 hypothetical protein AQ915_08955 [Burkholderia pseudomallei]